MRLCASDSEKIKYMKLRVEGLSAVVVLRGRRRVSKSSKSTSAKAWGPKCAPLSLDWVFHSATGLLIDTP